VAGRGYWWFNPYEAAAKWVTLPPSAEHEEVIDFIVGVANTIPDRIVMKGRPRFGNYIIRLRELTKQ
jgi:hypothetical protein